VTGRTVPIARLQPRSLEPPLYLPPPPKRQGTGGEEKPARVQCDLAVLLQNDAKVRGGASRPRFAAPCPILRGVDLPANTPDPLAFLAGGGELGELIRTFDWRATSLGPPEEWPAELLTAVRIMLTSTQPIWIGWGDDLTYLYNDPYKAIIGGKHPRMLGQPTKVVWEEIWDTIGPMLEQALSGDKGTYVESQPLIMERNGYPEETYYTFSYGPIPDDSGRPRGSSARTRMTRSARSGRGSWRACASSRRAPSVLPAGARRVLAERRGDGPRMAGTCRSA